MAAEDERGKGGGRELELSSVRFEPSGRVARVQPGETLFAVARSLGLPVGTSCRAEGICGRCGLRVLAGTGLSPEGPAEVRVKAANGVDPALRLSCLAEVHGDLVVTADYW